MSVTGKWLIENGLTNSDQEDYGIIATAEPKKPRPFCTSRKCCAYEVWDSRKKMYMWRYYPRKEVERPETGGICGKCKSHVFWK